MKRTLLVLSLAALSLPLFAQTNGQKLIARVNGREITNRDLDEVWNRVPEEVQKQYLQNGGKKVFLQNYVAKLLLVQDAVRSGFAAKVNAPKELDAAAEAALFDRYVREVVAGPTITVEEMRKVYDDNRANFAQPEQARLRTIRALKGDKPETARETISKAMIEIFSARAQIAQAVPAAKALEALGGKFSEVAARVSDDESARVGGDMGWVALHTLDPKIAQAARSMTRGTISGIIETPEAFQLVLVDEYRPAGTESFDTAQPAIREFLMARNAKKVMEAVAKKSAELRAAGKVEFFVENLR